MPSKKRKRLDKKQSQIVIVGSGLAGLSAAIALERAGFNVAIYERDASFDQQKEGYGLTLTYNPKGPLAKLGVLEQVAQRDCPSRSHYLFQPDGSILGYFGNAFSKHRGLGQRGNLRVPRKVLRRILLQTLQKTKVHWNHKLVDYKWDATTEQYNLELENSTGNQIVVTADLLVAADGIRSAVLQKLYRSPLTLEHNTTGAQESKQNSCEKFGLRYMGVRLILGIADFTHPLLTERGFYTLDGKHRLFTMPYQSNRFAPDTPNRIMWQLSFATDNDEGDESLEPSALRDYVLNTVRSWHSPVLSMIQATPLGSIWGTDLMDRDPKRVSELLQTQHFRRLVVVGDALHPMSPFKGQGANQALTDGPLLACWLQRASIDSAITGCWREIVQRTAPVVEASRQAAQVMHSREILQHQSVAGVEPESLDNFLCALKAQNIGGNLGVKLDEIVAQVIEDRQVAIATEPPQSISPEQQAKALEFAKAGDTQGLRQLSLAKHAESIRTAMDSHSRTCLHLAAEGGHTATCKWLLTELDFDCNGSMDGNKKTAMDSAIASGNENTILIFRVAEKEKRTECSSGSQY